jgi:dTDP-4-amino-4,6-dideoxygalactose transaminase
VSWPSDQDATGRSFDDDEIAQLRAVLDSGVLTATKGSATAQLETAFANLLGVAHAVACSSGTSAIHAAVAALDPDPGDEIITTPITDMGALTPILYQGAIPVFADVDADTGNVTAATVAARLSDRTRAIVVTHLFGLPAEVDAIASLAAERGIPVIEDCAQAYLARRSGRIVGGFGAFGCFSLQQGKHITTGEGGLVVSPDNALAREARLWVNKGWAYGEPDPDHRAMALNARTTELQSAVALAQLAKLDAGVQQRIASAEHLTKHLDALPGLAAPPVPDGDTMSYWRFPLLVDLDVIPGGPGAIGAALRDSGIASSPRYIQKPAFACGLFRDRKGLGSSGWPFTQARPEALDHDPARFPGAYAYLDRVLVIGWNEKVTEAHADRLADALRAATSTTTRAGS